MKKVVFLLLMITLSSGVIIGQDQHQRLENHLGFLAADSLCGRQAGSVYALKAADYIAEQFAEIGLTPMDNSNNYFDDFSVDGEKYRNVIGMIEGSDEVLRDELIVIGAHYDHLGIVKGEIYNGADDNASGTAALIEVARAVINSGMGVKRTVVFVAFDAEEIGLYGSKYLAEKLPVEKVKLMVSMDMVGWLREGKALSLMGVGTIKDGKELIGSISQPDGLVIDLKNFETSVFTATDTEDFAKKHIPTLAVTTGAVSPYHKPEDDAHLIDYDGLNMITNYMTEFIVTVADVPELAPSGKVSFKHSPQKRFETGVMLSIGSSSHHYYKEYSSRGKFAFGASLFAQYNVGILGIRPSVWYTTHSAPFISNINTDPIKQIYRSQSVGVPLDLVIKTSARNPVYAFASFGGYYAYNFSAHLDGNKIDFDTNNLNRHEWGLQWGIGVNIYNFFVNATSTYSLTDMRSVGAKITNSATYMTVGYRF